MDCVSIVAWITLGALLCCEEDEALWDEVPLR